MGSKVAVIGTGYVGLTTGACFAHLGHDVVCADVDAEKVDALEPGRDPDRRGRPRRPGARGPALGRAAVRARRGRTPSPTASSSTSACRRPRATTARADLSLHRGGGPRDRARPAVRDASSSTSRRCRSARPGVVERVLGRPDVYGRVQPRVPPRGLGRPRLPPPRPHRRSAATTRPPPIRVASLYLGRRRRRSSSPTRRRPRPSSTPPTPSSPPSSRFVNAVAAVCEARRRRRQRRRARAWATTSASARTSCSPGPGWGGSCFPKDTQALRPASPRTPATTSTCCEGVIAVNDEQFERVGRQDRATRPAASLDGQDRRRVGPHVQGPHRRPARLAVAGDHRAPARARARRSRAYDPTVERAAAGRARRHRGRAPTPTRRARAPTCSPCSPSGTSSAGSTSTRSPTSMAAPSGRRRPQPARPRRVQPARVRRTQGIGRS